MIGKQPGLAAGLSEEGNAKFCTQRVQGRDGPERAKGDAMDRSCFPDGKEVISRLWGEVRNVDKNVRTTGPSLMRS